MQIFPQLKASGFQSLNITSVLGSAESGAQMDFASVMGEQFEEQSFTVQGDGAARVTEYSPDASAGYAGSASGQNFQQSEHAASKTHQAAESERASSADAVAKSAAQQEGASQQSDALEHQSEASGQSKQDAMENASSQKTEHERAAEKAKDASLAGRTEDGQKVGSKTEEVKKTDVFGLDTVGTTSVPAAELDMLDKNLRTVLELLTALGAALPKDSATSVSMSAKVNAVQEKVQALQTSVKQLSSGQSVLKLTELSESLKQVRQELVSLAGDAKNFVAVNASGANAAAAAQAVREFSMAMQQLGKVTETINASAQKHVVQTGQNVTSSQIRAAETTQTEKAKNGSESLADKAENLKDSQSNVAPLSERRRGDSAHMHETVLQDSDSHAQIVSAKTAAETPGAAEKQVAKTATSPDVAVSGTADKVAKKVAQEELSQPQKTAQPSDSVSHLKSSGAHNQEKTGQQDLTGNRQGFFQATENKSASRHVEHSETNAGIKLEANIPANSASGGMDSSKSQVLSNTADIAAKAKSADVARQIENGAFKDLGQGQKQLTIRLDPQDLGQVNVILQVKGKEVQATLRTTNQETAQALNEQISQLKTQLESQGLKVTRLEVQTQLPDAQADTQWQGTDQHNRYQEQREQTLASQRLRNLGRMDVADLVQDVQNTPYREKVSLSGLDIFA